MAQDVVKNPSENDKIFGGFTDVGRLLGISPQAVEKAYRAGRITSVFSSPKGLPRFALDKVVDEYRRNTGPCRSTQFAVESPSSVAASDGTDATDIERYNKARADNEELKTQTLTRDLEIKNESYVSVAELRVQWTQVLKAFAIRLSALPQKLLTRGDITEYGRDRMDADIRQMLIDLSTLTPGNESASDAVEDADAV